MNDSKNSNVADNAEGIKGIMKDAICERQQEPNP